MEAEFNAIDDDKDGKISRGEFMDYGLPEEGQPGIKIDLMKMIWQILMMILKHGTEEIGLIYGEDEELNMEDMNMEESNSEEDEVNMPKY